MATVEHLEQSTQPDTSIVTLPSELIHQILACLDPYDLTHAASTCTTLNRHTYNDQFWQSFINENLPSPISSPWPAKSFRDLYLRHHPYWFVPRHRIWYSDSPLHGKIVIARYDPRRACTEGYAIVATRGDHEHGVLPWPNQVLYDTFKPKVSLDLNQPVLRLDLRDSSHPTATFSTETRMKIHSGDTRRISSVFLPTRNVIDELKNVGSASLWPPQTLPSPDNQRTRNQSPSCFGSSGHTPRKKADFSDATFRIRQWVEYSHFIPMAPYMHQSSKVGEVVHTWGTLPEECYTPTEEKPWQGIWCGDYGGHGCEFLLITQPDKPQPLPRKAQTAFDNGPCVGANRNNFGRMGILSAEDEDHHHHHPEIEDDDADDDDDPNGEVSLYGGIPSRTAKSSVADHRRPYPGPSTHDRAPYRGRLEAVKLTGDPNVPRGEYTFIAPDIGINGLVGYASEDVFNDRSARNNLPEHINSDNSNNGRASSSRNQTAARIVKGVGHIAGEGFSNDTYIPTQLIMISENRLAQYWLPFRHVSFFERVDVMKLLHT